MIDQIRKKRWAVAALLLVVMFQFSLLLSCAYGPVYPESVAQEVKTDRMRIERYIELMDEGKTTREQDQRMLKACLKTFQALEFIMFRGKEKKEK